MNQLIKVLTPLFLIIIYITFSTLYDRKIEPVHGYPIWMKSESGLYSQQTSGLFFIGREGNKKFFLSANDNSRIDRISIDDSFSPPKFDLQTIHFDLPTTIKLYKILSKWDFEDIVYDRISNKIIVSIEGNNDFDSLRHIPYKSSEGIYEFTFKKTIFTCDSIYEVNKLPLPDTLFKYTRENVGFEGMSMTDNYFYFGLENIAGESGLFSDSTYLYVLNRKTNDVKIVRGKSLGVRSITGLFAKDDYTLYGVDRELKRIFCAKFNPDFSVREVKSKAFDLPMPLHSDIFMDKMAGVEAIAMDDENYIYTDIDPWSDMYTPNFTPKSFLSEDEKWNITKLIPVIYKYKNPF